MTQLRWVINPLKIKKINHLYNIQFSLNAMFTININPIILQIGVMQITYYSLVYILGFLTLLFILLNKSKQKEIALSKEQVYNYIILLIIGIIVGARIFHILFWDFEYFSSNIIEIFYIWNGGLSFHGGLVGAIIVSYLYCRKNKINFLQLADIIILPTALFLALGRIANLINHEIIGKATNSSFCVNFPETAGCRHPIQLYAALGRLMLFFFLLKISYKKHKEGLVFFSFIFLISIGRFLLDIIREDIVYLYLTAGQWLSLILIIISGVILLKNYIKTN